MIIPLLDTLWQVLELPKNYNLKYKKLVKHNDLLVNWYRYQKNNDEFSGEHVSLTVANDDHLQGLVVMDSTLINGCLPSADEAKRIACDFIAKYAEDLVDDLELEWIAEHEEIITVNDKAIIVKGMKVKCRIKSRGQFSWVIVGNNNLPIAFERDIIWNYDMSQHVLGMQRAKEILGEGVEDILDSFAEVSPDFAKYVVEYGYGDLYTRDGFSDKYRELAAVACLIGQGNTGLPLKAHLNGMLNVGWKKEEIIETLIFLTGYVGFPSCVPSVPAKVRQKYEKI